MRQSRLAPVRVLRKPMSDSPSISRPSSTTMFPEDICSCSTLAGTFVVIHAGSEVGLKPSSSMLCPLRTAANPSLAMAFAGAPLDGGAEGAGAGAGACCCGCCCAGMEAKAFIAGAASAGDAASFMAETNGEPNGIGGGAAMSEGVDARCCAWGVNKTEMDACGCALPADRFSAGAGANMGAPAAGCCCG